jgi:hypothetical protein
MVPIAPIHEETQRYAETIKLLSADACAPGADDGARQRLLAALGCVYKNPTIRTSHASVGDVATAATLEYLAVRAEGLAWANDAYGITEMAPLERLKGLLLLMPELVQKDSWTKCLMAPHSPHALACNLMRVTNHARVSVSCRAAMLKVLNDWIALSGTPPKRRFTYSDERSMEVFDARVVCALFGEYWWEFKKPDAGGIFDCGILLREMPDFLPGLLPDEQSDAFELPDAIQLG